MTKFTKISATALFALFLTACDKPANKTEAPKAEATPATQAEPATQAPTAQLTEAEIAEGKADYQKLLDWNKTQERTANAAQKTLQEKLAASKDDPKKVEAALTEFTKTVTDTINSLDAVEVKNSLAQAFKAKTKEVLGLSNVIVADSVNTMAKPSPEAQEALKGKIQQLQQQSGELLQLQTQLEQLFGSK